MTSFEVGTMEQLTAAVDSMSNEQLTEAVRQQEGGSDRVLDQVFEGMRQAFDPAKAAGQAAVVQYEIAAPDGPRHFLMRVADGRCQIERGSAENPRVTIRIGLADFLRLVAGRLNGMQAFMSGKLKVSGDLFFAQTYQAWFNRPAAS
jgi:putative sterol carrier protein